MSCLSETVMVSVNTNSSIYSYTFNHMMLK